jgi:hypothetical protein
MDGSSTRILAETLAEVAVDGKSRTIDINPGAKRFEIRAGELVAFLTFGVRGSALLLIHTEVPAALRDRGLAETPKFNGFC